MTDQIREEPNMVQIIPGFGQRIIAMVIDWVILTIVGFVLGGYFSEWFAQLGIKGLLVGFLVALSYFGFLNSHFRKGQTIGKEVVGIRAVDVNGEPLSLIRSLGRAFIFIIPFLLSGTMVYSMSANTLTTKIYSVILAILVWGILLCQIYLYVFNTPNRQVVHDIVFGTYVIKEKAAKPVNSTHFPPVHYLALSIILLIVLTTSIVSDKKSKILTPSKEIPSIVNALNELDYFTSVVLFEDNVKTVRGNASCLFIHVSLNKDLNPRAVVFQKVIETALQFEYARNVGLIDITIDYGYNIGIVRFKLDSISDRDTVQGWEQRIKEMPQYILSP